jgi:tetratricopeptide (TPR) repeat protein
LDLALEHYGNLGDTYGETGARLLDVRFLENAGELETALEAVQRVIDLAREHGHERLVMAARLRHGELLLTSGQLEKGLEVLRECLGLSILHGDRNTEFHAHYQLWKAYGAIGDRERADLELRTAKHRVQHIDEITPEATEVLSLSHERGAS